MPELDDPTLREAAHTVSQLQALEEHVLKK